MSNPTEHVAVTPGSGNVFADLGYENADEMLLKAQLVYKISTCIAGRHLSQVETAKILGVDQPKVSELIDGRLSEFSVERLLRFLTALGEDVEIVVKEKPQEREHGRITVVVG